MRDKTHGNKLFNEEARKSLLKFMDMANALHHDALKYRDLSYQDRFNKLFEKYELLYLKSPGLFQVALKGELYSGEIGKVVNAFQSGGGDPQKIYNNLNAYTDDITKQMSTKAKLFVESSQATQKEQDRIQELIRLHQQEKNSKK